MYGASRGAFTKQTLRFDEYGLQIFRKWNQRSPNYVQIALGDHHRRTVAVEMWKSFYEQRWNIYMMLWNEYKHNFISVGPLTIRVCTLNDAILVLYTSLFFIRTHNNDSNDAMLYVWRMYRWTISPTRRYDDRLMSSIRDSPKTLYAIATSSMNISSSIASYWL